MPTVSLKTPVIKQSESAIQKSCVRWFDLQYPQCIIFAIPNGGRRDKREAAKLKAEGVRKGVHDLFIVSPSGNESKGLFIEMKTQTGRLSNEQRAFGICVSMDGYNCAVARSLDEFIKIVKDFFNGNIC